MFLLLCFFIWFCDTSSQQTLTASMLSTAGRPFWKGKGVFGCNMQLRFCPEPVF